MVNSHYQGNQSFLGQTPFRPSASKTRPKSSVGERMTRWSSGSRALTLKTGLPWGRHLRNPGHCSAHTRPAHSLGTTPLPSPLSPVLRALASPFIPLGAAHAASRGLEEARLLSPSGWRLIESENSTSGHCCGCRINLGALALLTF